MEKLINYFCLPLVITGVIFMYDEEFEEEEECIRDPVTGKVRKGSKMHVLNKSRLSKHEMDELFYLEL
jgi:hypothetical protein